jgi:uncharacterized membrane protein
MNAPHQHQPNYWIWWILCYVTLLAAGVYVAVRQPVFFAPDEGAHYLRAYEVSQGHWVNSPGNVGTDIPCNDFYIATQKYHLTARTQPAAEAGKDDTTCKVQSVNTAGTYSPVAYIPAAIALMATAASPVEDRLRAGRMANVVVWLTIIMAGVLWLQRGRLLMGSLVVLPVFFWQITMLSADGATLAFGMALVCWIVGMRQRGYGLSASDLLIPTVLAALLGASKGVYVPIALLCWGLWNQMEYRNPLVRLVLLSLPCAAGLGVLYATASMADRSLIYLGNGAVPADQLALVLADPMRYLDVVWNTVSELNLTHMVTPDYAILHARNAHQITWLALGSIAVLMATTDWGLTRGFKLLAALLLVVCTVGALSPLYLTYSPVGANLIWGVQGRYYIPLLPLLMLAFSFNMADWDWDAVAGRVRWIALLPLLGLVVAIWRMWKIHG